MDGVVKLPGGFRVDGRLIDEVEFRELSGYEEDIMADISMADDGSGDPLVSSTERVTRVLSRCTVRLGDTECPENRNFKTADHKRFYGMWNGALAGDRSTSIVMLRRLSLGDAYVFSDICADKECRAEIKRIRYDLGNVRMDPFYRKYIERALKRDDYASDEDYEADIEARRTAMLLDPKPSIRLPSGTTAFYRLFTTEHELALSKLRDVHRDKLISALIGYHLVSLDGEAIDVPRFNSVKALPARDRQFLLSFFGDIEGGIDTNVDIVCPKCGHSFTKKLDVTKPGFFYLSAAE